MKVKFHQTIHSLNPSFIVEIRIKKCPYGINGGFFSIVYPSQQIFRKQMKNGVSPTIMWGKRRFSLQFFIFFYQKPIQQMKQCVKKEKGYQEKAQQPQDLRHWQGNQGKKIMEYKNP